MLLVANAADVRCRYREPDLDAAAGRRDGTREEHAVGPAFERSAGCGPACRRCDDLCCRATRLGGSLAGLVRTARIPDERRAPRMGPLSDHEIPSGLVRGLRGAVRRNVESKDGAARDGRPYRAPREAGLNNWLSS